MIIRQKDKERLKEIFDSAGFPFEIWAYGSRIDGSAHEGSDIDLVVRSINLEPLPLNILNELTERIRESNIPIIVELRDWAKLPETFHKNIERKYEVLYSNLEMTVNEPIAKYGKQS